MGTFTHSVMDSSHRIVLIIFNINKRKSKSVVIQISIVYSRILRKRYVFRHVTNQNTKVQNCLTILMTSSESFTCINHFCKKNSEWEMHFSKRKYTVYGQSPLKTTLWVKSLAFFISTNIYENDMI